jgi:hypothetical protein
VIADGGGRVATGCGAHVKEDSALGGKVSGAGPGVEPEEGEAVEAGLESVKLLTFGDGKVDKDAVLQAGKTQIKRLEATSQEIVLEVLDIGGGLVDGGIEPPGLGLVQKIIDQVNELAGGIGDFGDHGVLYEKSFLYGEKEGGNWAAARSAWGRFREGKASWISSGAFRTAAACFLMARAGLGFGSIAWDVVWSG